MLALRLRACLRPRLYTVVHVEDTVVHGLLLLGTVEDTVVHGLLLSGIVEDTVVHGLLLLGTVVGHSLDRMKTRFLHGRVNIWTRC